MEKQTLEETDAGNKFHRYRLLAVLSGLIMIVSPMIGLAGTVLGMMRAFDAMGTQGIKDPGVLSQSIGEVLIATFTGFGVAFLGLPFFITFTVLAWGEHRRLQERKVHPPRDTGLENETP